MTSPERGVEHGPGRGADYGPGRRPGRGRMAAGAALLLAIGAVSPAAAKSDKPVIAGYGAIFPTGDFAERPDPALRYRVLFGFTKAAADPAKVNPSLEKVARFLNLLGTYDIHPQPGDIVVIVHGAATPAIANDAVYRAKAGAPANPDLPLIRALRAAGVTVAVCSQALHGNGIDPRDVADGVRVDVSALTTVATLQLKGWAFVPD